MVKEVVWTDEAKETFEIIVEYLNSEWSHAETNSFLRATERILEYVAERPTMFRKTDKRNVHEALVTKHNLLIYRIKEDKIELITFWDTRQNPHRKKYKTK